MKASPQDQAAALLLLREQTGGGEVNPYDAFKEKYFNDLAGFVRDCFLWEDEKSKGAVDYQEEAMRALVKHRRVSLRGPHGLGKTSLAAWVVLWFALTRDGTDWKIPTTASAWRQLTKFLWPEIHKWARRIKWETVGREPFNMRYELTQQALKLSTGQAFAIASDNSAMMEGAHADQILYLFDEAKVIPGDTWDAAEGAMSVGAAYMLAISTPGEPLGRFYEIQAKKKGFEDWHVIRVTMEQAIKANRMSKDWAKQRAKQWGEDSAVYKNRVLGEFASSDEDTVISLASVERSNERWLLRMEEAEARGIAEPFPFIDGIGADIGRGGDPSVIALKQEFVVTELRRIENKDVMSIAGMLHGLLERHKKAKAYIDVIGIGAGVVDRLREFASAAARVVAFNAAGATDMKDEAGELGFVNLRAAGWWAVRTLLNNDMLDLPPNDELLGELVSPKWKVVSSGKIRIEEKEEIKKRIGRSTNHADPVMQMFAPVPAPKTAGVWGR